MIVRAIKTEKVTPGSINLFEIFDKYLPLLNEQSVVAVTSKVVSICEEQIVKIGSIEKEKLIEHEADYFLPPEKSKYNITLTIKNNILIPTAGIDESNGAGYYILWPKNAQRSANRIRNYLVKKYNLRHLGVIITDSKTTPLRWGTTGIAIAYAGFMALNDYIGKPDIFNYELRVTKANIADGLAAVAVVTMGEGQEQTPLAIIEDVPFVRFQARNPTKKELEELKINREDDLYAPLLNTANWQTSV